MDDLKDAAKLADYAKEMRDAGDMPMSSAIASRAKARLSQVQEDERSIKTVMERMEGPSLKQNVYEKLLEKYVMCEHDRIHKQLEAM